MHMTENNQNIELTNEERLELENVQLKMALAEKEMQEQFERRGKLLDKIREKHDLPSDAKLALDIGKGTLSVLKVVPELKKQGQAEG